MHCDSTPGALVFRRDFAYNRCCKIPYALSIGSHSNYTCFRPITLAFSEYLEHCAYYLIKSVDLSVLNMLRLRLGAFTAFVVWSAFPEDPYVLCTFGFLYSIPCFYYIVAKPQYATSARFVLLTYNLTCLYW